MRKKGKCDQRVDWEKMSVPFVMRRHWKKDCPKLKKKDKGKAIYDACVIEYGGDSSDYELCLVGHQTIVGFDE